MLNFILSVVNTKELWSLTATTECVLVVLNSRDNFLGLG